MSAITAFNVPGYILDAIDEVHRQRDSARRWAVNQEQRASEYERRITVALMLLDEGVCECSGSRQAAAIVCTKHAVEDVLRTGVLP